MPQTDARVIQMNNAEAMGSAYFSEGKAYERELALIREAGGDAERYGRMGFNAYQLEQIRQGLTDGIDVTSFADPSFSWMQMEELRKEIRDGVDLSSYRKKGYAMEQIREIRKGLTAGLDVSMYDRKDYLSRQMRQIRLGLQDHLPVVFYLDPDFGPLQMGEIRKGLLAGVDISAYARVDVPYIKMRAIRESMEDGLFFDKDTIEKYEGGVLEQIHLAHKDGLDLMPYAAEGYDARQLTQIRISLAEGLSFEPYIRLDMRGESLKEIRLGLEDNLNVLHYARVEFNWRQMHQIRLGLENQVDVTRYTNPLYTYNQMREIRLGLQNGLDVTPYCSMLYTSHDMREMRERMERGEEAHRALYEWTEIPENYDDPRMPLDARPNARVLAELLEKEKEALRARQSGETTDAGQPKSPTEEEASPIEQLRARIRAQREAAEQQGALETPDPAQAAAIALDRATAGKGINVKEMMAHLIKVADGMKGHHLTISPDKLTCRMILPTPTGDMKYTSELVHALLIRAGVISGIDEDKIKEVLEKRLYDTSFVAARGTPAKRGTDGRYEYLFERNSVVDLTVNPENRKADFASSHFPGEVKAGQKLAIYHPAGKGTDGRDVTGAVIRARNGLECPVLKGRGFLLLPDGVSYAAALSGVVRMEGNRLDINRLMVVEGDLKKKSPVDFLGSVWVKGAMEPGASIKAHGDVIVEGLAESAVIESGGDVVLKSGAVGRGGRITAAGIVAAKNMDHCRVDAVGSVFSNTILYCDVFSEGKVVCFGDKGTIYGGKIEAYLGTECAVVGSKVGTPTTIRIGTNLEMWEELSALERRVSMIEGETETLTKEQAKLTAILLSSREQLQWKIKINAALSVKERELAEARAAYEEKKQRIQSIEGAEAHISKMIYAGVTFFIDQSEMQFREVKEATQGLVLKHNA